MKKLHVGHLVTRLIRSPRYRAMAADDTPGGEAALRRYIAAVMPAVERCARRRLEPRGDRHALSNL